MIASKKDLVVEHVVCCCVKVQGIGFVPIVSGTNKNEVSTEHKFPVIYINKDCKHCNGTGFYHLLHVTEEFMERVNEGGAVCKHCYKPIYNSGYPPVWMHHGEGTSHRWCNPQSSCVAEPKTI